MKREKNGKQDFKILQRHQNFYDGKMVTNEATSYKHAESSKYFKKACVKRVSTIDHNV